MIKTEKEPPELNAGTGVYEHCIFCDKPTDTWHIPTNQPVCSRCAKIHKVSDIKAILNK